MNRHLSRIIVMQSLYESDFRVDEDIAVIAKRNISQFDAETDQDYIFQTIVGVKSKMTAIDPLIQSAAPEWPVDQIAVIDKTVLRLATYELLFSHDVPPKVVINEAVELAKSFGSENSSKFINGVLGTLYRNSDLPQEADVDEILSLHEADTAPIEKSPLNAHVMDEIPATLIPDPAGAHEVEDDIEHIKQTYSNSDAK